MLQSVMEMFSGGWTSLTWDVSVGQYCFDPNTNYYCKGLVLLFMVNSCAYIKLVGAPTGPYPLKPAAHLQML